MVHSQRVGQDNPFYTINKYSILFIKKKTNIPYYNISHFCIYSIREKVDDII